ncbi:unnamed protein product [Scytosiphon promiscuus]
MYALHGSEKYDEKVLKLFLFGRYSAHPERKFGNSSSDWSAQKSCTAEIIPVWAWFGRSGCHFDGHCTLHSHTPTHTQAPHQCAPTIDLNSGINTELSAYTAHRAFILCSCSAICCCCCCCCYVAAAAVAAM